MEFLIAISLFIYFVPVFIAAFRSHTQFLPILLLDLLLGWTFIGWIAALIWSVTNQTPQQVIVHTTVAPQANETR